MRRYEKAGEHEDNILIDLPIGDPIKFLHSEISEIRETLENDLRSMLETTGMIEPEMDIPACINIFAYVYNMAATNLALECCGI
jgi:hypothetical protein